MDYCKHLNYSLGNEDWGVEEQALQVAPKDRVVCVTASGDRPLHLLITDCAEILSIDMNRIQNYLLALKITAISKLDYEKYLAFLGCTFTPHRYDIFKQIKYDLTKETANFWEEHKNLIQQGIIYQGIVERFTSVVAKVFNLLRRDKIRTLFSFNHIEEQRDYLAKEWDTWFLRKTFQVIMNPKIIKFIIKDPGLNSFVDSSINPGVYIYQRMLKYLTNNLARKSPLLQLVLIGKLLPDAYFPYLTFAGYSKIRRDIGRLSYRTDNIVNFLTNYQENGIDCFSMSDIASYMPQSTFDKLLHSMHHAAKPNARFCLREFMSKRRIPDELSNKLQRNKLLEEKLENQESNFVYRFFVGEIKK